jgi:uncharacterized protein
MAKEIIYWDISKKGKDLLGTKDVPIISNDQAIKESIYNLFHTQRGTRLMNPEYGLDMNSYLFEPIDDFTAQTMQYDIKEGIERWETRIKNLEVEVIPYEDENAYVVNINFTISYTNTPETLQIRFQRVR